MSWAGVERFQPFLFMKLSILICTLPDPFRDPFLAQRLFYNLSTQAVNKPVQVLYLGDNKRMSVGLKRNMLLHIAEGERVIFVDDDDQISNSYVDKLLEYCEYPEDCIAIGVEYTQNGTNKKIYDFSFKKNINTRTKKGAIAGRMPNHLCLWKREVALRVQFPNISLGEDHNWAEKQIIKGYSLKIMPEILYFYDFDRHTTQTRMRK